MEFDEFFRIATSSDDEAGFSPFPYQHRLGTEPFPTLLDIPTGLGKTAAITIAWLYKRLKYPDETPRRLIYCLPMRTLVRQTLSEARQWIDNTSEAFSDALTPSAYVLMGGDQETGWADEPERPAIVVGTQDMLISRALMRGYGMNQYKWPMHYAWLHNDALWVFDETQLMGVTVETSAQLEAFRREFGTDGPTQSVWMSATLGDEQLDTVDHRRPDRGWERQELDDSDRDISIVRDRISASKPVQKASVEVPRLKGDNDKYLRGLVDEVVDHHVDETLTLVIVNRVERAQQLYEELLKRHDERDEDNTGLLHSRFRRPDRRRHEELLHSEGDRIIVSTQVVEAGLDISAQTMFTELAPWPSLVQRFGRCNRYGEQDDAQIFWIDIEIDTSKRSNKGVLPYDLDAVQTSQELMEGVDDAGPNTLDSIAYEASAKIRPVIRRKDLLELFDTTPDLSGNHIDVSRYIRDDQDTDIQFFWRLWEAGDNRGHRPPDDLATPGRDELCRVPIGAASKFVDKDSVTAWEWDGLDGEWRSVRRVRPGQTILLDAQDGGYDDAIGWTGKKFRGNRHVPLMDDDDRSPHEANDDDDETDVHRWVHLTDHLQHVGEAATELGASLALDEATTALLRRAAHWHDVGKAHRAFQHMLLAPIDAEDSDLEGPTGEGPWAKSNHRKGTPARKNFRHELASALAFLQAHDEGEEADLITYLIAAHHGKVRLSIRSLPTEEKPDHTELFARGVWHDDSLPALEIPGEGRIGPFVLDLSLMNLGRGSWLEKTIALRDRFGPFRLARLEALLRLADHRASAQEKAQSPTTQETGTS